MTKTLSGARAASGFPPVAGLPGLKWFTDALAGEKAVRGL